MKGNYVLTIAGAKGGVGKTTTSTNLGACFADAGYRTVVVEADVAMANLVDFVDLESDAGAVETLHDVLTGESTIVDAVHEVDDRFAVIPSGTDIDRYSDLEVDRLAPALEHLRWLYDVVIFDTPAGMGEEVILPLELADDVVLISTPRVSSIRNTQNTKRLVEQAGTDVRGLVLTKSGTGASPGADRIAEFLDLELLGHVPEDDAVPHSQDQGVPVVEYAPRSGAAIAYRLVASQLIETTGIERGPSRSNRTAGGSLIGHGEGGTTIEEPRSGDMAAGDEATDDQPATGAVTDDAAEGSSVCESDDRRPQSDGQRSGSADRDYLATTDGAGIVPGEPVEGEHRTGRNASPDPTDAADGPSSTDVPDDDATDDPDDDRSEATEGSGLTAPPDAIVTEDGDDAPRDAESDDAEDRSLLDRIRSTIGL